MVDSIDFWLEDISVQRKAMGYLWVADWLGSKAICCDHFRHIVGLERLHTLAQCLLELVLEIGRFFCQIDCHTYINLHTTEQVVEERLLLADLQTREFDWRARHLQIEIGPKVRSVALVELLQREVLLRQQVRLLSSVLLELVELKGAHSIRIICFHHLSWNHGSCPQQVSIDGLYELTLINQLMIS